MSIARPVVLTVIRISFRKRNRTHYVEVELEHSIALILEIVAYATAEAVVCSETRFVCHSLIKSIVMIALEFLVRELHKYDQSFLLSGKHIAYSSDTFRSLLSDHSVHFAATLSRTAVQQSHIRLTIKTVFTGNILFSIIRNKIMHGFITHQLCRHLRAVDQFKRLNNSTLCGNCIRSHNKSCHKDSKKKSLHL